MYNKGIAYQVQKKYKIYYLAAFLTWADSLNKYWLIKW